METHVAKSRCSIYIWQSLLSGFDFGVLRIKRKPTNYVKLQTITLILIQIIPLWILPTLLVPWLGHIDLLPSWFKTQVLMVDSTTYLTGSNCWRIYGLVLAWPLFPFIWLDCNVTSFWLIYGILQTFIIIPSLIYFMEKEHIADGYVLVVH